MTIRYVCQFHGRFTDITQVSDTSWSMTLEELVLDTKYPVGREWDEDGYHYISNGDCEDEIVRTEPCSI
jgi:hypothetical protein